MSGTARRDSPAPESLLAKHDVVLLDLDGTVYRGGELIEPAGAAIDRMRRESAAVRYVTNNASSPAEAVAGRLAGMGLPTEPSEVSTSAQAAAAVLAEKVPADSRVLVVGTAALASEVRARGLVPVSSREDEPVAVVQGHSPETGWQLLAEACLAIRGGALWIACNGDLTLPSERGELPGNGAMVEALRAATGVPPQFAGKPLRPLLDRAVSSAGGGVPLLVGDRLDTDIAGAVNAGIPAVMVFTGVDDPAGALFAEPGMRPDYLAEDLGALHRPPEVSAVAEQPGWKVRVQGCALELAATSERVDEDRLSALRALCAAWWPAGSGPVQVRADDPLAASALRRMGWD